MSPRKFFVGGNFKMNGTSQSLKNLVMALNNADLDTNTDIVIAPPSLYLIPVKQHAKKQIMVAAQNGYLEKSGAFTGEISFHQLADEGIPYVILGHSERRALFHETSPFVGQKSASALLANLSIIACIGETLSDRESDRTSVVVREQLDGILQGLKEKGVKWDVGRIVLAYEPVWAIGTGIVATPEQAQEVHVDIREWISEKVGVEEAEATRIIYGGSVSAKNCDELAGQPDIDGFLVGGASLKPEFVQIINTRKSKL